MSETRSGPAAEGAQDRTKKFADLRTRFIWALVIGNTSLFCVWMGGYWTAAIGALAAALMMVEWRSITMHRGGTADATVLPYLIAAVGPMIVLSMGYLDLAWTIIAGGILAGIALDGMQSRLRGGMWSALGALYIGLAGISLIALRDFDPFGFLSILWAGLVVIAADTGGYFAGRMIGGAKLWPSVSPKKTWAGLGGGVILAAIVGAIFSGATTGTYLVQVCTVSMIAAVLAQAGDLAESALKRHFGVKDAGTLIPGHGGVLDRMDGHMAATLVAAAVTFSRDQAVFVW
ncbi:MAG: phosphatidate cytidylyltransferase [Pseudomonadota bacterium]